MKFAIIETGGKQYRIEAGQDLRVEKLTEAQEGGKVAFDKVLLLSEDGQVQVGMPYIEGATVECAFVENGKAKKVTVIKYKQKSRYFKKKGHRQPYTAVKVEAIKA
ncbi:MAG: 50S ribosomal protein L21 [Parcubacteria group bacterium]|nr:50S ribosomal protein L21 [Parcubacteria group bacterium]